MLRRLGHHARDVVALGISSEFSNLEDPAVSSAYRQSIRDQLLLHYQCLSIDLVQFERLFQIYDEINKVNSVPS